MKRLSVPVIVGCDFQRDYTRAILPQDGKISWTTGAVSPLLGYHLGARGRQYKKLGKTRARPNELTLAGVTVLPPGAQTPVKVVTRSTGSFLIKGRAEFLAKHGLHLAHGYHKKVRRQKPFSVLFMNLGRTTKTFTKGTQVGVEKPYTGEARPLSQEALLSVQQELAVQEALDNDSHLAQAEAPPEAPLAPPTEEPETPVVNWDAIPEALHGKVRQLLDEFKGMWSGRLGELKATTHHIQLKPDAKPVYSAPYRAGPHRRQEIEKQVKKMLDLGVIEPSDAEWSFPVVVAPMPGGHLRFCVDYRRVNERTVKDVYPIPRMDDCLDSLGDATEFSTLDCNAGYWQIPVTVEDRDKTTFTSHTGLFRFLRIPVGLVNTPASFQRALDIILSGHRWQTCLGYLDDVFVFSRTVDDHVRHLREVLLLLETAGVSLKPSRCHFFHQEVEYLGHIVRPGQLLVNQKNIKSLAQALHHR